MRALTLLAVLSSLFFSGCLVIGINPPTDQDGDGFSVDNDCDDTNPDIHPNQEEPCVCDLIDQNCNGIVDDFPCDLACIDNDNDGFPSGIDCNDNDPSIHPDQEEPCLCDAIDQNCNGDTQDFLCEIACGDADGDGFDSTVDCNDNDPSIHPDQAEPCTCDGIDQNCNGVIDDFPCDIACLDNDSDGFPEGIDCNDSDPTIHPDQEEPCICDAIDQNCNGETQDFLCDIACGDADGDGFGSDVDCNDNDPTIHPDQEEPCTCDAIDQNCNGIIDDFPCDIPCIYLQEGQVCGQPNQTEACEPGLLCCYPCGIPGCDNLCSQPFEGGCPLFP